MLEDTVQSIPAERISRMYVPVVHVSSSMTLL